MSKQKDHDEQVCGAMQKIYMVSPGCSRKMASAGINQLEVADCSQLRKNSCIEGRGTS
jgi:hypothetical protein